ncbi:MAG: hypothetical protein ACP5HC_07790 [Caldisericum sp.]
MDIKLVFKKEEKEEAFTKILDLLQFEKFLNSVAVDKEITSIYLDGRDDNKIIIKVYFEERYGDLRIDKDMCIEMFKLVKNSDKFSFSVCKKITENTLTTGESFLVEYVHYGIRKYVDSNEVKREALDFYIYDFGYEISKIVSGKKHQKTFLRKIKKGYREAKKELLEILKENRVFHSIYQKGEKISLSYSLL